MINQEKIEKLNSLNKKFMSAKIGIVAEYKGLSVEQLTDLRKNLRGIGTQSEFQIVKNTLARKASKDTPFEGLGEKFVGPTSLLLGYTDNDIILLPKIIVALSGKVAKFKVIAGAVDGKVITLDGVKKLSESLPREELIRKILISFKSPVSRLVNSLNGVMSNLTNVLRAINEKKGSVQ